MLQIRHKSLNSKAIELLGELPAEGGWIDLVGALLPRFADYHDCVGRESKIGCAKT